MAKFTLDQITEALEAVVRERGEDYTYQEHFRDEGACKYIQAPKGEHKAVAACIVGVTFNRLGVSDSTLHRWDKSPQGSSVIDIQTTLIPQDARTALQAAQETQDRGGTWGEALEVYKNKVASA